MPEIERLLGQYGADIEHLKVATDRNTAALERIEAKINKADGGIRMLIGVGTIAGAIGAGLAKVVSTIKGGQ